MEIRPVPIVGARLGWRPEGQTAPEWFREKAKCSRVDMAPHLLGDLMPYLATRCYRIMLEEGPIAVYLVREDDYSYAVHVSRCIETARSSFHPTKMTQAIKEAGTSAHKHVAMLLRNAERWASSTATSAPRLQTNLAPPPPDPPPSPPHQRHDRPHLQSVLTQNVAIAAQSRHSTSIHLGMSSPSISDPDHPFRLGHVVTDLRDRGRRDKHRSQANRLVRERACWRRLCAARKRLDARLKGLSSVMNKYQDQLAAYKTALATGRTLKTHWERAVVRHGTDSVGYGELARRQSKRCFEHMCELDALAGRCDWAADAWTAASQHFKQAEDEYHSAAEAQRNPAAAASMGSSFGRQEPPVRDDRDAEAAARRATSAHLRSAMSQRGAPGCDGDVRPRVAQSRVGDAAQPPPPRGGHDKAA